MHELIDQDIQTLWHYMQMHQPPDKADCLLVLGSIDDRVAVYAAGLAKQYHYWYVVVSGGDAHNDDLLATNWPESTEAEHFAAIMQREGYTKPIMLETKALNTGQNATLSYELLHQLDTPIPLTIQLVTKPYMERRALATFQAQWPDKDATFRVCSPPLTFEDYCTNEEFKEKTINIMVGDMQRIMSYPARGWQTEQDVPGDVHAAYSRLVAAGFTQHIAH